MRMASRDSLLNTQVQSHALMRRGFGTSVPFISTGSSFPSQPSRSWPGQPVQNFVLEQDYTQHMTTYTLTHYLVIIHFELICSPTCICSHTFPPHINVLSPLRLKRNTCIWMFSMLLSCTLKLNTPLYGNYFQAYNEGSQLPTGHWGSHLLACFLGPPHLASSRLQYGKVAWYFPHVHMT